VRLRRGLPPNSNSRLRRIPACLLVVAGRVRFENLPLRLDLTRCSLPSGLDGGRNLAVFGGEGVMLLGGRRFAFDPNRYGLLIERVRQPAGDWLSVSFGTVDAPLVLAGFPVGPQTELAATGEWQASAGNGMNCRGMMEVLSAETLELVRVHLDRGDTRPNLGIRRER
jgi:hypothetical protein